jgi:coproporphyrinogen dehydrogenase HemZ
MKINIKLNDMSYRYDVYQIFNIYFISKDIKFGDNFNYCVEIGEHQTICSKDSDCERKYEYRDYLTKRENIRICIFLFLKEVTGEEYPWGTLIGIRPSKIALKLMKNNSDEEIVNYFKVHNLASEEKSRLCLDVAKTERKYINKDKKIISVYIGMPFCPTKCLYCSFTSNSIESGKGLVKAYIEALFYEMDKTLEYILEKGLKVQCVYFGGGTPTSVSDDQFDEVMKKIYENFVSLFEVEEFTVECGRPDSITLKKLQSMKKYAVDRISINPQTMNDETLKLIGRNHTSEDIIEKFKMARSLGFDNINMDIIVGLPYENIDHIRYTCDEISKLKPENITVHSLAIKRGSRLYEKIINSDSYVQPEQSKVIGMFNVTRDLAESLDMKPYYMYRQKNMVGTMENIGYSITGREGIYNVQMIEERQTIIACGADAVTKVYFPDEDRIERAPNIKGLNEYISRIDETINKKNELLNTLF